MVDLTGLPALDLAIGLAFIFFLLATLASVIQEFIAGLLGLRSRTLEQGLRSMLEDPEAGWKYVDRFYDHPLIRSLYRTAPPPADAPAPARGGSASSSEPNAGRGKNIRLPTHGTLARARAFFKRTGGPSYIAPRAFALTALDIFETTSPATAPAWLDELPPALRQRVQPLVVAAEGDVQRLRTALEAWFDDTMARVSGWYKRKTQVILLVIGAVLVLALNANTLVMAERMWKDDTVRAAVVAQAQATASGGRAGSGAGGLEKAADDVDRITKLGIPMGWRGAAVPSGLGGVLAAICGWLLTILAISLGAPFWFDALSRLSRLRSSGKPETPLPPSGSGKANERILTPPQVPTVILRREDG